MKNQLAAAGVEVVRESALSREVKELPFSGTQMLSDLLRDHVAR